MRHCKVLITFGYSFPIATEFVDWLYRWGIKPSEILILGTKDENVRRGYIVVREALYDKYKINKSRIRYIELPFEDPLREEDFREVLERILDNIGRRAVFNIAGGRKNTVVAAYFAAMLTASKVYHIIHKDVRELNAELERLRYEFNEIGENPDKYYEYKDKIDKVLFPHPAAYEVIEIPIIPLPRSILRLYKLVFSNSAPNFLKVDIEDLREELQYLGYLHVALNGEIIPTSKGKDLLKILEIL